MAKLVTNLIKIKKLKLICLKDGVPPCPGVQRRQKPILSQVYGEHQEEHREDGTRLPAEQPPSAE